MVDTAESFHFLLFFTQKKKKSANNRLHDKHVKYSNSYDVFAYVDQFLM